MSVTWNCSHDSWNHEGMNCFEETGVKVTFKTYFNLLTVIEKIVQVDFSNENRILFMVNDRTEVFILSIRCRKR